MYLRNRELNLIKDRAEKSGYDDWYFIPAVIDAAGVVMSGMDILLRNQLEHINTSEETLAVLTLLLRRQKMLSCECETGHEVFYETPENFTVLKTSRRRRCISCNKLINLGVLCLSFFRSCLPRSYVAEIIYDETVPLANRYMCEECGEIFFNLTELGYCFLLGDDMRAALKEYHNLTGFKGVKDVG